MKISVTFRNAEGESWQREYVEGRLQKLNKYIDTPAETRVVLSVEKFRNVAEMTLTANGVSLNAREQSKDMHLAIDEAVEKIERQLKKHKEKARRPKGGIREEMAPASEASAAEVEETPSAKIVETRKMTLKPMSIEDALLAMETTRNRFILYRNTVGEGIHLLFRRDDDRYVLIETE